MLATGFGDPRLPPGTDDAEALLLATALADARPRTVLAASGVPPSEPPATGDVARTLLGLRPDLDLRDGGTEDFEAVMALAQVAWSLGPPDNQAFRARRLALALTPFAIPHPALPNYEEIRIEALARRDEAHQALDSAVAQRVEALPRKALVVTRALGAGRLCDALEAAGRGGRLVTTGEGRTLLEGEELFWAGVGAGLPEPKEEGLMPWARALGPFHEAFQRWPGRARFTEGVAAVAPDSPPLAGPLRDHVLAAAELLAARGLAELPADLPLHEGTGTSHAMSYDSFTHRLKVSAVVAELSVPLAAAVLLHELVHVEDVGRAAAHLGTDPRGFALLIDRLPVGIGTGVLCCMEDHAYHREIQAVPTLGIRLPDPEADAVEGPQGRLEHMLAVLMDAGPASSTWLALIDGFVGIAREGGP